MSDLPVKEPDTKCNARKKNSPGYCSLPAGYKTGHVSVGRCLYHGGAGSTPKKGLIYSEQLLKKNTTLSQVYEELSELDKEEVEKLDDEINFVRASMLTQENLGPLAIQGYVNSIEKLVRTKIEIEKGLKSRVPNLAVEETIKILSKAIEDVLGDSPSLKASLIARIEEYLKTASTPVQEG